MALARIGIGSNVGDAVGSVMAAFGWLTGLGVVRSRSSLYASKAWGVTEQPDFINAAALLETPLEPYPLLRELKSLELRLGRVPTYRWGPRVIDLDILSYDDLVLDEPDLTIPHPRLHERAFALVPLAEIDAAFAPLLEGLPSALRYGVERIASIGDGCADVSAGGFGEAQPR